MILIGLGANLPSRFGGPPETLAAAILALEEHGLTVSQKSRIWLTAPVPVSDQPWYHNAVVEISTPLSANEILKVLQSIENDFGRIREVRNEPRVIDLDLLAYNDQSFETADLVLPHPRLHQRAFVLLPIQDIAPKWSHPVSGLPLADMIATIPAEQMAKPSEVQS
jgi:2-amino-4-hydroxy-6-hydroxymethyldihydropteridine diphosphokinase